MSRLEKNKPGGCSEIKVRGGEYREGLGGERLTKELIYIYV